MDLPDLSTYGDDDFESLRQAVETERLRRIRIASTPDQVATLAKAYTAAGGKLADLTAAIDALDADTTAKES